MEHTTPGLIRADFVRQINAIEPSHPQHQTSRFRPVRSVAKVQSAELRNYHISIPRPAQPQPGGFWGSGVSYAFEMRVWVSYGHLAPEDDDSIITSDGADIWSVLQARYEPALPGLISVEPFGWEPGTERGDDDGYRWGAFVFEVVYMHDV